MISPINPGPQYSQQNEQQFRTQVRQETIGTMKSNEAQAFILMRDKADGKTYKVELDAGALTFTVVPV